MTDVMGTLMPDAKQNFTAVIAEGLVLFLCGLHPDGDGRRSTQETCATCYKPVVLMPDHG